MKILLRLFFILIIVNFKLSYAQELPPLINYTPSEYAGENQNWKIDQAKNGELFVGNNSGLLQFNGASWSLHTVPNNSVVRSVKIVNNKVFTGCYMEFGYWVKNDFGNLIYISLIDKLPEPLLVDETFWNIINVDNYVLFQSLNRIYVYNIISDEFNIIASNTNRAVIYKLDNEVYFQKSNEGIFKIENGKANLITNNSTIKNTTIVGMFNVEDKKVVLTQEGNFYQLQNNNIKFWKKLPFNSNQSYNIYSSILLSNGNFAIGTISNGVFITNNNLEVIYHINKEKGLLNNTILSLYEDVDKNLWLGLDNGISVININSPYTVYNDFKGEIGSVYASIVFNNKLYLGTNQGLFYKTLNTNEDLQFISNTKGQVWCLRNIENQLFCGHNNGTYIINENKAKLIADFPGTWDIKPLENNKSILIQGNYSGLSILEKINNQWVFKNKLQGFNISSRFFEMVNDNEVIVNHEYRGVFKLTINNKYSNIVNLKRFAPFGVESSLVKFNNTILHSSNSGIYNYNSKVKKFIKNEKLSALMYTDVDPIQGNLIADTTNKLWGFTNRNIVYVKFDNISNKPKRINIPVERFYKSSEIVSSFESINHLYDENYIIGNLNGYTILNLDNVAPKQYKVIINSIYKQIINKPKKKLEIDESANLKSNEKHLYFEFSVPEFKKNVEVDYKYRLIGLYNEWSGWSATPSASFENLPYGDYKFEVKARIGNNISENTASYSFEIDKPWFLSTVALLSYLVLTLIIFLLIHNFYKRYYHKQEQKLIDRKQRELAVSKLESEKLIMKLRNDKLRNEIDGKTRELATSTLSIVKKNEILNTIKKELLNINKKADVDAVVKIIDNNLSTEGDWAKFKEAFNNADTDFLKKVKEIHPNLTPNDLRLCAYLRLNLSSKEIAPLLNISPRSVEIKRYRLRKKMDLPHKQSLVEYILNV